MPTPNDVHSPVPRTWEYVTLHGKRDLAEVIGLNFLGYKEYFCIEWFTKQENKMNKSNK